VAELSNNKQVLCIELVLNFLKYNIRVVARKMYNIKVNMNYQSLYYPTNAQRKICRVN